MLLYLFYYGSEFNDGMKMDFWVLSYGKYYGGVSLVAEHFMSDSDLVKE